MNNYEVNQTTLGQHSKHHVFKYERDLFKRHGMANTKL